MYYRLVERVAAGTKPEILSTFGMNLGYFSWTLGARVIREIEEKRDYNIPWCIQFYMENGEYMPPDVTAEVIKEGKSLGIHTYLFYLEEPFDDMNSICSLIATEPNCAFILLLHPSVLMRDGFDRLAALQNAWILIDMDTEDAQLVQDASAKLRGGQCMAGGFTRTTDEGLSDRAAVEGMLQRCDELGLPFLTFMNAQKSHPTMPDGEIDTVSKLRDTLPCPVFPIDLFRDVAQIDCNISTEACLTIILGNGTVLTKRQNPADNTAKHSIHTSTLSQIFMDSLPKATT